MLNWRRRLVGGAGAAAGVALAGCVVALREGVFNACVAELPSDLREHPLVLAEWRGVDANEGLAHDAVEPLRRLRHINTLLCDFVLKGSLAFKRQGFAPAVFETATFFRRPG